MCNTRPRSCRGVSLIELVVFIVLVGIALAGVFAAFNTITAASADPQVRKQVLAIAESLMEEITLMPFTYCDADDANAETAGSGAGCAVAANNEDTTMGPEGTETRYNTAAPLDNVSDYHGLSMVAGIKDITNATISGLGSYSASVTVSQAGLASGGDTIAAIEALRISVTATHIPSGTSITLEGYRTRYAPNTIP